MAHLADKLKQIAMNTKAMTSALEEQADAVLAQQSALNTRIAAVVDSQKQIMDDATAGVAALEDVLKGITN
jgi:hypothetical protein